MFWAFKVIFSMQLGLTLSTSITNKLKHSLLYRYDPEISLPHQTHRKLPHSDNAIYNKAEKSARAKQREAFRKGILRRVDCVDNLWDSDPGGPPPEWDNLGKRRSKPATTTSTQQQEKGLPSTNQQPEPGSST